MSCAVDNVPVLMVLELRGNSLYFFHAPRNECIELMRDLTSGRRTRPPRKQLTVRKLIITERRESNLEDSKFLGISFGFQSISNEWVQLSTQFLGFTFILERICA